MPKIVRRRKAVRSRNITREIAKPAMAEIDATLQSRIAIVAHQLFEHEESGRTLPRLPGMKRMRGVTQRARQNKEARIPVDR